LPEVLGEVVGEEGPAVAPDGVGGLEFVVGGGVEEVVGTDLGVVAEAAAEGGIAAPAAVFGEAELASLDGFANGLGGDAELCGGVGEVGEGLDGDGAAEALEDGPGDRDGVGEEVGGGVVGRDRDSPGGDAAVVGAEGDAPLAEGAV
jgi:hypothetical protein